jgi:hypothetical protein
MTYEGHYNWETWNVSLWLNNDQNMYNEAIRICKNNYEFAHHKTNALESYVFDLLDNNIITDKISINRVNFKEIVKDFEDTIKEIKDYEENHV